MVCTNINTLYIRDYPQYYSQIKHNRLIYIDHNMYSGDYDQNKQAPLFELQSLMNVEEFLIRKNTQPSSVWTSLK